MKEIQTTTTNKKNEKKEVNSSNIKISFITENENLKVIDH